jgi:hypothetical protein
LISNRSQLKVRPLGDFNGSVGKIMRQIGHGPKLICLDQPARHSDANEQTVFCLNCMKDAWTKLFSNLHGQPAFLSDSEGDRHRSEQVHLTNSGKETQAQRPLSACFPFPRGQESRLYLR